jgi:hypothetical protein
MKMPISCLSPENSEIEVCLIGQRHFAIKFRRTDSHYNALHE